MVAGGMLVAVEAMGTILFLPIMKTHLPTVAPQLVRLPLRKGRLVGPMKDTMDLVVLPMGVGMGVGMVVLVMAKMMMENILAEHSNAAVEPDVG